VRNDVVKIPAAAEPLDVSWVKQHTHIPAAITAHDSIIRDQYMMAAREQVENDTGRLFVQQTRVLYLDRFPNYICIPRTPVRSLVSIKYLDQSQVLQTFDLSSVVTDVSGEMFRIALTDDALWPVVDDAPGAVRVEYRAGYAAPFTADNATNTFTAADHDLSDGDAVRVVTFGGTLPAGLEQRTYYVTGSDDDTFQLSLTDGGSAVSISDDGSGELFVCSPAGFSVYTRMAHALAIAASTWFENRESVVVGETAAPVPMSYESLVNSLSRVMF
jgi:uncharacterized phiE125 gp8 family phage protein